MSRNNRLALDKPIPHSKFDVEKYPDIPSLAQAIEGARSLAGLSVPDLVEVGRRLLQHKKASGSNRVRVGTNRWSTLVSYLLHRIYKDARLDGYFANRDAVVYWAKRELMGLPAYDSLTRRMKSLDDTEMVRCMREIHTSQAESLFKVGPVQSIKVERHDPCGGGTSARYDPKTKTIRLNLDRRSARRGADVVRSLVHETTHYYQDCLAAKVERGLLRPGHVAYKPALLFWLNLQEGGYLPAGSNYSSYANQPLERHAFWLADEVARTCGFTKRVIDCRVGRSMR